MKEQRLLFLVLIFVMIVNASSRTVFAGNDPNIPSEALMDYYKAVKSKVDKEFKKSAKEKKFPKGLIVKITSQVDKKGRLKDIAIKQPSGNDVFDQQVLDSLRRVHGLPKPPKELLAELLVEGFLFEFKPGKINSGQ